MSRLLLFSLLGLVVLSASPRVVVVEQFTATWCTYCPGVSRGLDESYERMYDSVVVIAYHPSSSDPYYSAEAATRSSYYSLSGYPTAWFDGVKSIVGGVHTGTMYPSIHDSISARTLVDSPLEIALECVYDSVANTGTVTATILNTSGADVSGNLHFAIVENDISYNWQGMTKLFFVMRDMLPTAAGEAVTIPTSDTIIRERVFTVGTAWNEYNCKIVVFVQASNRAIQQGAEIGIAGKPRMSYVGLSHFETSGNGNGWLEPDETFTIGAFAKNFGDGVFDGTVTIQSLSPYVTVDGSSPAPASTGPGDVDSVLEFTITTDPACPNGHLAEFEMAFDGYGVDTFPMLITNAPGFSDDIESGQGDWTHGGIRDNWHVTEHRSNSATHSWYCGVENTWQYTAENDASLMTPYFVVPPDSSLTYYEYYNLENNWDYGFIDIDNGSGHWRTIKQITGAQTTWSETTRQLADVDGETVRIRFRVISDYNVQAEGWYIDDIRVPYVLGVAEYHDATPNAKAGLALAPVPCRGTLRITASAPSSVITIYDAGGRCVATLPALAQGQHTVWDCRDSRGRTVPNGTYLVQTAIGEDAFTKAVIVVR